MKQQVIKKAVKLAYSLCPINREIRTSHVAFLIKSNVIEKIGVNKRRTHPEISKHPYHEGHVGIHAELDCVLKVDKEDLRDYKMLVLRVDRKNKLNMSKPCPGCLSLINQFNIGEVWYSDKNGQIVKHNENKQQRK
jgi:deoxycytidylate deaminase